MIQGQLKIGEAHSPPLIKEIRRLSESETPTNHIILDAPPGTSCPVIEAVNETDFIVLVTEPTPFGLHDLKLAVDMAEVLKIPFGVVINRSTIGDKKVWTYCNSNRIAILGQIPDDRKIAEAYSRGVLLVDILPQYRPLFKNLFDSIMDKKLTASEVIL
jgi:MinD superfamily P-loop ATPase